MEKSVERLAHVLAEFDFVKVQKVMELLDWKWASTLFPFCTEVPSVYEMVKTVISLWKMEEKAINSEQEFSIYTGGFELAGRKDIDNTYYIELRFVVEKSETYPEV